MSNWSLDSGYPTSQHRGLGTWEPKSLSQNPRRSSLVEPFDHALPGKLFTVAVRLGLAGTNGTQEQTGSHPETSEDQNDEAAL
ncbi:hypothetical protein PT974_01232 [Cladobotryum mycophilum]|uniref:Uncharacterized protein n=1 Tax=Cladobotryum mycophilum TaxID=491253 RepID=A0ABR0T328_9HYPO